MRDRILKFLLLIVLLASCNSGASRRAEGSVVRAIPGSFVRLGGGLDLRSACRLKSWRTLQASGYDRGGGFYDSGNFLRIEDGPRYVLMETDGPGCIDRMWFTYKREIGKEPYDLQIFLDGPSKPVIELDLDDLFSGGHRPFVEPLAGLCGDSSHPARYSYVPVGFNRACKVVLVPTAPAEQYNYRINSQGKKIPHIYYQITYRKFPPNTPVRRFSWELDTAESNALTGVLSLWSKAGECPWDSSEDSEQRRVELELEPGRRVSLFEIAGAGVIRSLELSVTDLQDLWLEMFWDKADKPDVSVPVGPFFACGSSEIPKQDVKGLWMGCLDGRYYSYLPMPFREGTRIFLISKAGEKTSVSAELRYSSGPPEKTDGVFCAHRYDYTSPMAGQDYTVLDAKGRGHFVGLVMDNPGHMEGDDRFYVDGEAAPSIHGTGTEDFFNFAWGLGHTASLALHGITIQAGRPVCYRMSLPAAVPFEESLLINWEHGHDTERGPNLHTGRYSGVVFYYRSYR